MNSKTRLKLNQIKSTISFNEIETHIIIIKRESEKGLNDQLSIFKEKMELSFKNEQKASEALIELLKPENISLKFTALQQI